MAEEEAIMKKRLALLLAVVLTFGTIFTGCGSKEESKESEDVTDISAENISSHVTTIKQFVIRKNQTNEICFIITIFGNTYITQFFIG